VNAARGGTIDVAGARTRAEGIVGSSDGRKLHELLTFAQYSDFDAYTIGHSVRVALLVTLVTERLGLERELMVEISAAALLHDVGKSQIPQEILYKSGPLTDDERRVISMHPRFGGEILLESREANPWSVCAAYGHHVRHDRRGYPTLPRWAQTSRATALIQVCDVFEALTAVRPYKPPLTPHEAYAIMLRDQKAFDPSALKAFVRAIGLYPPGSRVVLSDGREGIVRRAGEAMARPALEIRKLADGTALPFDASPLLDLGDPANAALTIQQIVREPTIDVNADPFNYENRATTIVLRDITVDPCAPAPRP
jgi:HD-GYP domain-containing protein (c-di-GMP phosphodiesterase class II)